MEISSVKSVMVLQKNKLIWLIFIIIGISTVQIPAIFVGPDLDASGLIALAWIRVNDLQIGQDLVSQFGPLAYLLVQSFVEPSLWFQSLLENIVVHFVFISSIVLLLIKLRVSWKDILWIALLSITLSNLITQAVNIDEQLTFSVTIFLYLILTKKIDNKYVIPLLTALAFLLAVESLIKVNISIVSIGVIVAYSLISVYKREFKKPIIFVSVYIICLFILWISSEQSAENFLNYFIDGLDVSSGYSYAMAINGPLIQTLSALVAITFLTILFFYSLIKKYSNLTIFYILNILLLYSAYKHAFVRHDGHVLYFYFTYGVFFISMYLIYKYDIPNISKNNLRLVIIGFLIAGSVITVISIDVVSPSLTIPKIGQNLSPWSEVPSLIFDESYVTKRTTEHKESLKSHLFLDEQTIQHIGNKTMDIFPYDIMIPWVYDFNWSPRPMPWSFQVFTPYLDKLNAHHFLNEKESPQSILYSYKSIDGRYPLYDEPLTFAAILENYEYVHTSREYALLSLNSKHNDWGVEEDLGTVESKLGEPIQIPKYDKGYVFAQIDLKFSSIGKIMNIMYKPSQAYIRFQMTDSSYSNEFRFIHGTANDGLFVSQYVGSINEFVSLLSGNVTQDIDKIIIYADDPLHFEDNIKVKFVGIPAKVILQKSEKIGIPNWDTIKLIQGGSMNIDMVDYKLYSNEDNNINIKKNMGRYIDIRGWAVDDLARDGKVKTFLVLQNEDDRIILPTHKILRPDVSKFFSVEGYEYGGWETVMDTNEFEHKCYTLSLRIPRINEQEYFDISGEKSICFGT
jgi:hypothetical protein